MHALKKVQVIYNCLPLVCLRDKQLHFSLPHPLQFIIPSHLIIQLLLHLIKKNAKQIVKDELERIAADENLKYLDTEVVI
jgi:hypothetical protein